ncbi:MAG TPA: MaoC family dehydratase N-terminal domain-containing protein [Ktedonobacteraceae bacterium]|jgi:acyl dehydratase|nr:MaoC family dehydratase N-terminal domain-containing protein [Ktedonobacteraceae bacterium]
MFDTSKVGHSFPAYTVEIERGKVHELAQAIGDPNPIYHSHAAAQEAGYQDVPLYPTAPTMFSFWGNPRSGEHLASVGIDVRRILHGEEEYEYLAPIYPGEVLTGVTTIAEGKSRKGMDIVTTETLYTNQQHQPVVKARTTIVVR